MAKSDYISREAARDLMEQALVDEWEIQYADDRLEEIPAADVVEMRHGKFEGRVFNTVWRIQSCSECREYVPQGDYCSNCGAKMDGV